MPSETNHGGRASSALVAGAAAQESKAMNRLRPEVPGSKRGAGGLGPARPGPGLRTLLLAALAVLSCAQALAATTPPSGKDYRLAGVMLVGTDRIGFLEVPAGGQVLVRLGSTVDGGKVTVFNDRELRIAFPGRNVVLELSGGATPPDAGALGVVTGQDDYMHVMVRNVDTERMTEALAKSTPASGSAGSKATKSDVQAEVGRRFAAVAGLPVNARVVAVNDQPVVSASKAIAAVEKNLAQGMPATLNLESPPGGPPSRVYLLPKRD
jgi:hypothetical protein